ncbi:DUF4189 domain-containing protein [Pseudoxanthomonas winnipegensis]
MIVKIGGHWDKTWGAIADSPNLIGGVSKGELSKQAAEQRALEACKERGGRSCVVSFAYFNQCVAVSIPTSEVPLTTFKRPNR